MTVLTCFLSSVRFSWIRWSGGLQHGARINTEAWTHTNSQPAGSVAAPGSHPGAWHLATADESICNTPRTPHFNPYPRPTHLHSALRHIRSQVWHVSIIHFAKSSKFKIVKFLQIQINQLLYMFNIKTIQWSLLPTHFHKIIVHNMNGLPISGSVTLHIYT